MITVQYRDSETEEILDHRYEEDVPSIGHRVRIGFEEHQVLFRWRTVPTCCIVYVRRMMSETRSSQQTAA